jgi:hypothetical protein
MRQRRFAEGDRRRLCVALLGHEIALVFAYRLTRLGCLRPRSCKRD